MFFFVIFNSLFSILRKTVELGSITNVVNTRNTRMVNSVTFHKNAYPASNAWDFLGNANSREAKSRRLQLRRLLIILLQELLAQVVTMTTTTIVHPHLLRRRVLRLRPPASALAATSNEYTSSKNEKSLLLFYCSICMILLLQTLLLLPPAILQNALRRHFNYYFETGRIDFNKKEQDNTRSAYLAHTFYIWNSIHLSHGFHYFIKYNILTWSSCCAMKSSIHMVRVP
jgi:hypothetical protein